MLDTTDLPFVEMYRWHATPRGYVMRNQNSEDPEGTPTMIRLHRAILAAPKHLHVDHINGDPLDNRRCNLRLATQSQNMGNARRHHDNTGFKGTTLNKKTGRWVAQICVRGKRYCLGTFDDRYDAALAYDKAATLHFGEFAQRNF